MLNLHLPFEQHSKLEVRPGETAREAIAKVLKKRNLNPHVCRVNVGSDPNSDVVDIQVACCLISSLYLFVQQDMETICSQLESNELWVHSEYLNTVTSIKHDIRRKTFIPPVLCDMCKNPIWLQGYRCELCQIKFHARCSSRAPLYCDLIGSFLHNDEVSAHNFISSYFFRNCENWLI